MYGILTIAKLNAQNVEAAAILARHGDHGTAELVRENAGLKLAASNDNQPGGRDLIGHSAIQPWSAGEHFPAVVSRVETYNPDGTLRLHIGDSVQHGRRARQTDKAVA